MILVLHIYLCFLFWQKISRKIYARSHQINSSSSKYFGGKSLETLLTGCLERMLPYKLRYQAVYKNSDQLDPRLHALKVTSKQGCGSGSGSWKRKRYFFCGSGSAKNPLLPLPHRREEWRQKRNWFCYPL